MKDDSDDVEARIAAIIAGAEEVPRGSGGRSPTKPRIRIDRPNPDRTVAALRDVLADAPGLFERGTPVRLIENAERGLVAQRLTANSLSILAHQICRPYVVKPGKDGASSEEVDAPLPRFIADSYLDWHGERRLRQLNGTTSSPILRSDGSFYSSTGYDDATGLWLIGAPDVRRLVPAEPTRDDAVRALRLLRRTFATFPFADAVMTRVADMSEPVVDLDVAPGQDESAFVVALLTAICRASLHLAPGILVRAPSMSGAGSGKGLLVRCISLIAFGTEPFAVTAGGDTKEFDKRIGAELMAGGPTLFLDNLNDRAVKSDLLASVITERPTRMRILGKSEMVTLNASTFIVLTGNGLSVSEDLARRFIAIEVDPKTEDPEARCFPTDVRAEVGRERAGLLAAGLTIWRWGLLQRDLPAGQPLGSFEQWAKWVRDPLVALGCCDPVRRVAEAKQRDVRRQELAATFCLWSLRHGAKPITAHALHDEVKAALDPQGRGRQFIASRLEKLSGTRMGGHVLTRHKSGRWSQATYALLPGDGDGHRGHRGDGVAEAE